MQTVNPERTHDNSQEKIINRFLQPYYYERLFQNVMFETNEERQWKGVDFVADGPQKNMLFDAKAQSSAAYINNPRPTFCLEVNTLNQYGNEMVGWFFNEENLTEYYTFVWIHEASVDSHNRISTSEDIKRVEVMTVDAKALKAFIQRKLKMYNMSNLNTIVQNMRSSEKTRLDICNRIHFSHSPRLPEKPVNIIVHKSILREFAIPGTAGHCMVTQGGVRPLKY